MKRKFLVFVVVLTIATICLPIAIQIAYDKPAVSQAWISKWGADAALSYVGSVLSAAGSIYLGYIAWRQTERIHKISQDKEAANTKRPFFIISGVYEDDVRKKPVSYKLNQYSVEFSTRREVYIVMRNIGDGPAVDFTPDQSLYSFGDILDIDKQQMCLSPNEEYIFKIMPPSKILTEKSKAYVFIYKNMLGFSYAQEIYISEIKFKRPSFKRRP